MNYQVVTKINGKTCGYSGVFHDYKESIAALKRIAEDIKHGDMMQDINTTRICHFGLGLDMKIPAHIPTDVNTLFVRVQRCEYINTRAKHRPTWLKTFEVVMID